MRYATLYIKRTIETMRLRELPQVQLISTPGGRFPRAGGEPPRSLALHCGVSPVPLNPAGVATFRCKKAKVAAITI